MSDLPGDTTKQILLAPPWIILSTRYSLTASGRSVSPSNRLPTGSSSFEKAKGCMRLPFPAAGMIPHISHHPHRVGTPIAGALQNLFQLERAHVRRVLRQRSLPCRAGNAHELLRTSVQRFDNAAGVLGQQELR